MPEEGSVGLYNSGVDKSRTSLEQTNKKIAESGIPANPTFPESQGFKYHRGVLLLLLSSEWDQVGHNKLNYQEAAFRNFIMAQTSRTTGTATVMNAGAGTLGRRN